MTKSRGPNKIPDEKMDEAQLAARKQARQEEAKALVKAFIPQKDPREEWAAEITEHAGVPQIPVWKYVLKELKGLIEIEMSQIMTYDSVRPFDEYDLSDITQPGGWVSPEQ
jgi:hypothetical protein